MTEVYGVDISQAFVRYASAQAQARRLDNAYFQVMDVLKPLDFDDEILRRGERAPAF